MNDKITQKKRFFSKTRDEEKQEKRLNALEAIINIGITMTASGRLSLSVKVPAGVE